MTYNSELKDGLSVNPDLYVKFGSGDDCKDDDNGLRALFDQVLSFFLKEVSVNKHVFRPFPPKFGDGRDADLFKLFLTVRRVGSYELVSKNEMWGFVARECSLEIRFVSCLKLIYIKYLKEFDQWLIKGGFKDENVENLEIGVIEKLAFLSGELDGKSLIEENNGSLGLDPNGVVTNLDGINGENTVKEVGFSPINEDTDTDNEEDDKQIEASIKNVVEGVLRSRPINAIPLVPNEDNGDSQKRKREDLSLTLPEMLDWLANAARDPHDLSFGPSHKLWNEALMARRALFAKLNVGQTNEAGGSQKKNQRMHPSMYDDKVVQAHPPSEPPRSNPRPKRLRLRLRPEPGKSSTNPTSNAYKPHNNAYYLGSLYQAEVPPWTGIAQESDPKWLGTVMWPGPDHENGNENENENHEASLVRTGPCECKIPGLADCVRFHVAETRLRLKLDLGPLFYKWKFNEMGEEISLSWEPEEEKRFKSLVVRARLEVTRTKMTRHEIVSRFWRRASVGIPAKTRQNVVSYYFNVFVLRRRSYQNRVTPREIDSDDDLKAAGFAGDRFGYEKIHGLPLKCSENLQRRDLDS